MVLLTFLERVFVKILPQKNWKSLNKSFLSQFSHPTSTCFRNCPIFAHSYKRKIEHIIRCDHCFFRNNLTKDIDLITFLEKAVGKLSPQKNWKSLNESLCQNLRTSNVRCSIFSHSYEPKIDVISGCCNCFFHNKVHCL